MIGNLIFATILAGLTFTLLVAIHDVVSWNKKNPPREGRK